MEGNDLKRKYLSDFCQYLFLQRTIFSEIVDLIVKFRLYNENFPDRKLPSSTTGQIKRFSTKWQSSQQSFLEPHINLKKSIWRCVKTKVSVYQLDSQPVSFIDINNLKSLSIIQRKGFNLHNFQENALVERGHALQQDVTEEKKNS